MHKLFLIFIFLGSTITFAQQNDKWYLICDSTDASQCGYATADGSFVIPPGKYEAYYTTEFHTIAFVKLKQKVWAINKKEALLFEVYCENDLPDTPSGGIFRIIKNSKIGYANLSGEVIIEPTYDAGTPFINGMAFINMGCSTARDQNDTFWKGGKWGAINLKGEVVIPIQYSNMNFLSQSNQEIKTPKTIE